MSLKARIKSIENKLPREAMSFTELSYQTGKPTEEEREIAIKYAYELDPPWKVMYVPYELRHKLESGIFGGRPIITCDDELGLYYDGETVIKMVEQCNKQHIRDTEGMYAIIYTIHHYDPDI